MQLRKTTATMLIFAGACLMAAGARAQTSLLPPACANLTGEALDTCVRNMTTPVFVPNFETDEPPPPDPAQLANCTRVLSADQHFCVWRNELLLACRTRSKLPDIGACFTANVANVSKPVAANCAREKPDMRAACAARNAVFEKCLEEPLSYFLCLTYKGKLPERMLKP